MMRQNLDDTARKGGEYDMRQVIDLSPLMQQALTNWHQSGHKLDLTLLRECAYYPKQGCDICTFNNPNPKCKRAHILVDTRIGFNWKPPIKTKVSSRSPQTKEEKIKNMMSFLEGVPASAREQILAVLRKEVR